MKGLVQTFLSSLFSDAGKRGPSQFRAVYKTPSGTSGEVILFGLVTQFERLNLEETITVVKDAAGWKLAGYNWLQKK